MRKLVKVTLILLALVAIAFAAGYAVYAFITKDAAKTRWRLYQAMLELALSSALARCGSESGRNTLGEYLKDVHSNFRVFAKEELSQTRAGAQIPAPPEERPL